MSDFDFRRKEFFMPIIILIVVIIALLMNGDTTIQKTLCYKPSIVLRSPAVASATGNIKVVLEFNVQEQQDYEIGLYEKDTLKDDTVEFKRVTVEPGKKFPVEFAFTPGNFERGYRMELYVIVKKRDGKESYDNRHDPIIVRMN